MPVLASLLDRIPALPVALIWIRAVLEKNSYEIQISAGGGLPQSAGYPLRRRVGAQAQKQTP